MVPGNEPGSDGIVDPGRAAGARPLMDAAAIGAPAADGRRGCGACTVAHLDRSEGRVGRSTRNTVSSQSESEFLAGT